MNMGMLLTFIASTCGRTRNKWRAGRKECLVLAYLYCQGFLGNSTGNKRLLYFVFFCVLLHNGLVY